MLPFSNSLFASSCFYNLPLCDSSHNIIIINSFSEIISIVQSRHQSILYPAIFHSIYEANIFIHFSYVHIFHDVTYVKHIPSSDIISFCSRWIDIILVDWLVSLNMKVWIIYFNFLVLKKQIRYLLMENWFEWWYWVFANGLMFRYFHNNGKHSHILKLERWSVFLKAKVFALRII